MTEERCEYPRCPGYEPDDSEPMVKAEDGDWHPECHSAWVDEQARFFSRQMADERQPVRAIEAVDDFLDDLLEKADDLRTAERER